MSKLFYQNEKMDEISCILTVHKIPIMQLMFQHRKYGKNKYWFQIILKNGVVIRHHALTWRSAEDKYLDLNKAWKEYWTGKNY